MPRAAWKPRMSRQQNKSEARAVKLAVRIQPRASKNEILHGENGELKIRLTAPPVEGAANEALVKFLSGIFKLPKSSIAIVSGMKSRSKVVRIEGVTEAQVGELLKTKR